MQYDLKSIKSINSRNNINNKIASMGNKNQKLSLKELPINECLLKNKDDRRRKICPD